MDIACDVVRLGDEFEWENGTDAKLKHVPTAPLNATMTHVWCVARFKDGGRQITVMRREEVLAIKAKSKSSDSGPWVEHEAEMWKKTAIRRAAKMWPLSPEAERAINVADRAEIAFVDLAGGEDIRR
jgi:recombination protein RecT